MTRIALLGATSHIAKGLIVNLIGSGRYDVCLFARSPERVEEFLKAENLGAAACVSGYEQFGRSGCDVIVNCVGIADPGKQRDAGYELFSLTERFDGLALDYLRGRRDSLYIHFSSGAVYGTSFPAPIERDTVAALRVNDINPHDYYRIAKINSEAKHRALPEYRIVDLRIFSYFSRFIDPDSSFLMTDIVRSLLARTPLKTTPADIIRDYVHPDDLFQLVELCLAREKINDAFDVYSREPVAKFEMLGMLKERFGLVWEIDEGAAAVSPTGAKNVYFSRNRHAETVGYRPAYTSLETIAKEVDLFLAHGR